MVKLGQLQRVKLSFSLPFIRRGPPLLITKQHKPLWFEKGWQQMANGKEYIGFYTVGGHTWRGLIRKPYEGGYDAYIWHPPMTELGRNTTHKPCFSPNGESGRYAIHFHTAPDSLDHAITNIETVLREACSGRS